MKNILALVALMVWMSAATATNVATKKSSITLLQTTTTMGGLPTKGPNNIAQNGKGSKKLGPATMTSSSSCMGDMADYSYCLPADDDILFSQQSYWMVEGANKQPQRLETVVTVGRRACYVWVSDAWGNSAQASCENLDFDPYASMVGDIWGIAKDIYEGTAELARDHAVPLIQQCIKVPSGNNTTPDTDDSLDWPVAKASLAMAYAGNIGSLRIGNRFDVKYANGQTLRLIITDFVSDVNNLSVKRWVDGVPNPSDNQCK